MPGDLSYFTGDGKYLLRLAKTPPPPPPGGRTASGMRLTLAPLDGRGQRVIGYLPMGRPRAAGGRSVDSFPVAIVDQRHRDAPHRQPAINVCDHGRGRAATAAVRRQAAFAADPTTSTTAWAWTTPSGLLEWKPLSHDSQGVDAAQGDQADIDSYVVEWGKRWIKSTGAAAEAERVDLRNDPYASVVPAFSQLIPDAIGRLWVREAHLADAPGAGPSTPPRSWQAPGASSTRPATSGSVMSLCRHGSFRAISEPTMSSAPRSTPTMSRPS